MADMAIGGNMAARPMQRAAVEPYLTSWTFRQGLRDGKMQVLRALKPHVTERTESRVMIVLYVIVAWYEAVGYTGPTVIG